MDDVFFGKINSNEKEISINLENITSFYKDKITSRKFTKRIRKLIEEEKKNISFCCCHDNAGIEDFLSLIDFEQVYFCVIYAGKRLNELHSDRYICAKILLDEGFFYIKGVWNFSKDGKTIKAVFLDPLENKFGNLLFQDDENSPFMMNPYSFNTVRNVQIKSQKPI